MKITIKRESFVVLACLVSTLAFGQKYDYNWIGGLPKGNTGGNAFMLNFNESSLLGYDSIQVLISPSNGQVTVNDFKHGSLLFYTNGNYIANSTHEIMENGSGLNKESPWRGVDGFYNEYCDYCYFVLPNLYDDNIFYLIHPEGKVSDEIAFRVTSNRLLITKVDMRFNNGLGKVIYKDSVILNQRTSPRFSAVKHANGKDWWIITRSENGSNYNLILLGDDKVVLQKSIENIDPKPFLLTFEDSAASAQIPFVVSPSGDLILERQGNNYNRLLSFDRCIGAMNYLNHFEIPLVTYITPGGDPRSGKIVSSMDQFIISNNSELAYAWGANGLYQWDLTQKDIASSRTKIFGPPIALDLYQLENPFNIVFPFPIHSPDGRIYYLWRYNHYIVKYPNERGLNADVIGPRALGRNLYFDSPNFPNYRLGPLKESVCDTLISGRQDRYSASTFKVYPNPTSGPLTIELDLPDWDGEDVVIGVYDALGRLVYRHQYARWSYLHQLNPGEFPPGVYFIRLELGGVAVQTQRIVVQ